MPADPKTPAPGQTWRNKRTGKRRIVQSFVPARGCWQAEVRWISDGKNHGHNSGRMLLPGWLAAFELVEDSDAAA